MHSRVPLKIFRCMPQEEDPEKYQSHFASYLANDLDGDSLEDMYKSVSAIEFTPFECHRIFACSNQALARLPGRPGLREAVYMCLGSAVRAAILYCCVQQEVLPSTVSATAVITIIPFARSLLKHVLIVLVQVHEAIRENPVLEKKERSKPSDAKKWKSAKLTYDERKAALKVQPDTCSCCCLPKFCC